MAIALTNKNTLDGLLSGYSWTGGTGAGATVKFGFDRSGWPEKGPVPEEFDLPVQVIPAAMRQITRDVLDQWSSSANITFTETASSAQAQLIFTGAFSDLFSGYTETVFEPGRPEDLRGSEVYLDANIYSPTLDEGLARLVITHEMGHALGLKHPHDGGLADNPLLAEKYDSFSYTALSYNVDDAGDPVSDVLPVGPQVLDIQALQYLYGKNTSYHAGADVYTLDGTHSADGQDYTATLYGQYNYIGLAVWDAGGRDRFDASGADAGVRIDLREGEQYFTRAGETEWRIAHGAVIEDATGSRFNDTITGNQAANVLEDGAGNDKVAGAGGNDQFVAGAGNDRYDGGSGTDGVTYAAFSTSVRVDLTLGKATGTASGSDTFISIENAQGGSNADTLLGNDGVNYLGGGGGNDVLDGRGGNDVLYADAGNDRFTGGDGMDLISFNGIGVSATVDLEKNTAVSSVTGSDRLASVEGAIGGSGVDRLVGNGVANTFSGGDGADNIFGRGGDDILTGGAGSDSISGAAGFDTVSYAGALRGVKVNLATGTASDDTGGTDTLYSIENAEGGSYADTLTGNAGDNVLSGGRGADTLIGGAGADDLAGNQGADVLTGGAGDDLFVYYSKGDSSLSGGLDYITDFTFGSDVLDVSRLGYQSVNGWMTEYNVQTNRTLLTHDTDDFAISFKGDLAFDSGDFIFAS